MDDYTNIIKSIFPDERLLTENLQECYINLVLIPYWSYFYVLKKYYEYNGKEIPDDEIHEIISPFKYGIAKYWNNRIVPNNVDKEIFDSIYDEYQYEIINNIMNRIGNFAPKETDIYGTQSTYDTEQEYVDGFSTQHGLNSATTIEVLHHSKQLEKLKKKQDKQSEYYKTGLSAKKALYSQLITNAYVELNDDYPEFDEDSMNIIKNIWIGNPNDLNLSNTILAKDENTVGTIKISGVKGVSNEILVRLTIFLLIDLPLKEIIQYFQNNPTYQQASTQIFKTSKQKGITKITCLNVSKMENFKKALESIEYDNYNEIIYDNFKKFSSPQITGRDFFKLDFIPFHIKVEIHNINKRDITIHEYIKKVHQVLLKYKNEHRFTADDVAKYFYIDDD